MFYIQLLTLSAVYTFAMVKVIQQRNTFEQFLLRVALIFAATVYFGMPGLVLSSVCLNYPQETKRMYEIAFGFVYSLFARLVN